MENWCAKAGKEVGNMKITIGYYEQTNGKITANSKKILEVVKGENAKDCMNQIYQKARITTVGNSLP